MQKTTEKKTREQVLAEVKEMIEVRNEALISLDKAKIIAYAQRYGVELPDDEHVFWIAVHKSILMSNVPMWFKMKSHNWLKNRGYQTSIIKMMLEHGGGFNG